MEFREIILNSEYVVHDFDQLDEYLELTSTSYDGEEYSELHHVLPKSMFREYEHNPENLVRLKYSDHIEAHRLLSEIFRIYKMKLSHILMTSVDIDRKLYFLRGDNNPAKDLKVRKKISESKLGKPRPDMKGKIYFGADKETYLRGISKMSAKLKDTVIVKDCNGEKFRVSVSDERYISGELVPFNLGVPCPNAAMKRPDIAKKCINNRNKSYEKFSKFSYEDMVDFLLEAHSNGKNIFPKPGSKAYFAKNYSGFCKRTKFDQADLKKSVVQRLSKG